MKPVVVHRVDITSVEAGYLTLGSWQGITKGVEIAGYCHECDDVDATGVVTDYFLDLTNRCVTAAVKYKCCGSDSTISYGVLDEKLLLSAVAMSRK